LCRLSVFVGSWTLEAAEEICAGDRIEVYDVLDLLTQLVNKSLVVLVGDSQSGETRYRMLETIRQYAREKLLEAGGSDVIRRQHLAYFVKLSEQAQPELIRSHQVFWLNKMYDELDNLRMAIEWALATNIESGLRLIANLVVFLEARCDVREVENWLVQLLKQYNEPDSLRVQALAIFSGILVVQGDVTKGYEIANESLTLSRTISDKDAKALSLLQLGIVLGLQGDLEQSFSTLQQSLILYDALGDKLGQAAATGWLATIQGNQERAQSFLLESLRLNRELGNLLGIPGTLTELAHRAIWKGDFSSAVQWLEEARTIYRQLGNQVGEGDILAMYGILAYWQGDYQQACTYLEESIVCYEKIGFSWLVAWSRVNMGYALLRQGNLASAVDVFKLSLQEFQKANILIGLVYTLEGLASLYVHRGQVERATCIFAWADATRDKIGDHRPPLEQASVERDLAAIHSQLNEPDFASLSAKGRNMTVEQSIAYALKEIM
jgi:tetratricopeptide (TPR) repeat protein